MTPDRIKVLYIAGSARSGTTIVCNVLGQLAGFCSVGELRYLWDRPLRQNWRCGCGTLFKECAMWHAVLEQAFGGLNPISLGQGLSLRLRADRLRQMPLMLAPRVAERLFRTRVSSYPGMLASVYRAIQSVTNCRVIVDSSKRPAHALLARMSSAVDLHVLHLVRDSRAVAYSWRRRKPRLNEMSPARAALLWDLFQISIGALGRRLSRRYFLMRYEDFIARPEDSLRSVLAMLGESSTPCVPVIDHEVDLKPTHTVSGNPQRFTTGKVLLELDREWQANMKRSHKALVTALTWPMLLAYGYSLAG